jgi:ribonuclease T1
VLSIGSGLSRFPARQALRKLGSVMLVISCMTGVGVAQAKTPQSESVIGTVPLASLPAEAQQTERLIRAGGPFPYRKDGTVFGNRERLLPLKPRGHYREYTVKTPDSQDRGARRIVCGGEPPVDPEACFYTADHYTSFRRIVQ